VTARIDLVPGLDGAAAFAPGQAIRGVVRWSIARPPERAVLRLCWTTRGRGDAECGEGGAVSIAELPRVVPPQDASPYRALPTEERAPVLGAHEVRAFRFTAPRHPVSFEGSLIAVEWRLALLLEPRLGAAEARLVIAPGRAPVRLADTR
jgi:hypothetical protein